MDDAEVCFIFVRRADSRKGKKKKNPKEKPVGSDQVLRGPFFSLLSFVLSRGEVYLKSRNDGHTSTKLL